MKLFKKLAVLCLSLTMCLGLGSTLTACGGGDDTTSSTPANEPIAYKFRILKANGDVAVGYNVYLCKGDDACGGWVEADSNGIVAYPVSQLPADKAPYAYDIHVMDANGQPCEIAAGNWTKTPATFSETPVDIILAD